jgi:hypothetical protein
LRLQEEIQEEMLQSIEEELGRMPGPQDPNWRPRNPRPIRPTTTPPASPAAGPAAPPRAVDWHPGQYEDDVIWREHVASEFPRRAEDLNDMFERYFRMAERRSTRPDAERFANAVIDEVQAMSAATRSRFGLRIAAFESSLSEWFSY